MATTTAKKTPSKASAPAARNRRRTARGGSGAELTSEQNAEQGFTASESLSENLQKVLVDLIELSLQGKQAHWNVVGRNFRDTHQQLDEIIDVAREFGDTVAERMRSLHALPDGRSDLVAQTTTLPEFPQGEIATNEVVDLMTERLDAVASTCRDVHDDVDEEDPTSADILHAILERVEQLSWMVSAENRTPKR
ncbi:MAG: Dps family protein [Microbacterium sp.]